MTRLSFLVAIATLVVTCSSFKSRSFGDKTCPEIPSVTFRQTGVYSGFSAPECPGKLRVAFTLLRRGEEPIKFTNGSQVSHVVTNSKQLVLVIHGYNAYHSKWQDDMASELLIKENYNVILVDWDSAKKYYHQSASDVRTVSAYLTSALRDMTLLTPSTHAWCIGHSLGAHICGLTGRKVTFKRITGLDPAGPLFKDDLRRGLNSRSAMFVDCLHTDGYLMGTMVPLGHLDIYPNDGAVQKGCNGGILCRHARSIHIFLDSINNENFVCKTNTKCSYTFSSLRGCTSLWQRMWKYPSVTMGYQATPSMRGVYTIATQSQSPYC